MKHQKIPDKISISKNSKTIKITNVSNNKSIILPTTNEIINPWTIRETPKFIYFENVYKKKRNILRHKRPATQTLMLQFAFKFRKKRPLITNEVVIHTKSINYFRMYVQERVSANLRQLLYDLLKNLE